MNREAGQADAIPLQDRLQEEFDRVGRPLRFLFMEADTSPEDLAREAVRQGATCVLLCGGDGTVVGGLTGLIGSGIPAALVPVGTGNLLAVNLDLVNRRLAEWVTFAVVGKPLSLDMLRIRDDQGRIYHSAVIAGIGYDARIVAGTKRPMKKRWGAWAYVVSALSHMHDKTCTMWITIDHGPTFSFPMQSALVANVGELQAGIVLLPEADPTDGLMNIAIMKSSGWSQWLRVVLNILTQRVREEPAIALFQARHILMKFDHPQPFQYDGEAMGVVRQLEVEILPGAATVMVPR
ncbi:MAG: hypothetical protein OHK0029_38750 [Armatimonadaceae bacterium]